MQERVTFSPLWHRVRALRPRLRPHCQITRQHYRGRRWHVVHDPTSNQFYRLSPIAYEFVGLLDGKRTVEDVWNLTLGTHGDSAPTQNEVIELLGQMYNTNLLSVDMAPEVEQLLARGRQRTKRRLKQQAIGIMYLRMRLFNPDRYLAWLEPIFRPILNRWGMLLWAAFIAYALSQVLPQWDGLRAAFSSAIAPANWFWIAVVFVITKAIHETGHGVICKRFGGQVPEFGVMLLVLIPAPFVDASACWAFPSKWQRMAVGAGGMIFELFVAAVAALVWLQVGGASGGGGLAAQLAYNAMFTASISTVLFNANPLMRFDGYYILSDLLEIPNLMQRSMKMLQHLCQVFLFRMKDVRPPSTDPGEIVQLILFGLAAMAYRIFLFITITLFVMGQMFAIGLVLAIWTAAAWFVLPIGGFVHWLATSPKLMEHRARTIATSVALALAGLLLLGAVPVPDRRRAGGVIESVSVTGVFFHTDGFVTAAHKRVGDRVEAGEPIVTCDSAELRVTLSRTLAEITEREAFERSALTARNPAGAQIARQRIETLRELAAAIEERIAGLVVRAPHSGVIVAGGATEGGIDPSAIVGSYVQRGQILCQIVDASRVRIAAPLTTAQAAPLHDAGSGRYGVELRLHSNPDVVLRADEVQLLTAGQRVLPHASLGFGGGGTIETDPEDRGGRFTKVPQFYLYVAAYSAPDGTSGAWTGLPGEGVSLRMTLPDRPLLSQWVDRLRRLIQGRVDI